MARVNTMMSERLRVVAYILIKHIQFELVQVWNEVYYVNVQSFITV